MYMKKKKKKIILFRLPAIDFFFFLFLSLFGLRDINKNVCGLFLVLDRRIEYGDLNIILDPFGACQLSLSLSSQIKFQIFKLKFEIFGAII